MLHGLGWIEKRGVWGFTLPATGATGRPPATGFFLARDSGNANGCRSENQPGFHERNLTRTGKDALEALVEKWYSYAMRRIILAVSLVTMTGCAGSYKASYVTGAVTKQFATESYEAYSEILNKKIEECDPENNLEIKTKSNFDDCLGPGFKDEDHDKIEDLVKGYHAAAKVHTDVMIVVDASDEERKEATQNLVNSAINFLEVLPNGDKLAGKLRSLIK